MNSDNMTKIAHKFPTPWNIFSTVNYTSSQVITDNFIKMLQKAPTLQTVERATSMIQMRWSEVNR